MVLPHRIPVPQPLGVVPHPVGVDDPGTGGFGDPEHPAVHMRGYAGHHGGRWCPQPLRPGRADQVQVAADAARGHQHGTRADLEVADHGAGGRHPARHLARLQDDAAHADHGAIGHDQFVGPVPEPEPQPASLHCCLGALDERPQHAGPRTPGDVEPRHRVAVTTRTQVAPLGPADHGKEPHPLVAQPGSCLTGGELQERLGPVPRPVVLGAIEAGAAEPVLAGQLQRVGHAQPTLLA